MQDRFILFVTKECPYCRDAIVFLEEKQHEYRLVEFNEDQQLILNEIKSSHDWKTVPMIFERKKGIVSFIGGYTDLLGLFKEKNGAG